MNPRRGTAVEADSIPLVAGNWFLRLLPRASFRVFQLSGHKPSSSEHFSSAGNLAGLSGLEFPFWFYPRRGRGTMRLEASA